MRVCVRLTLFMKTILYLQTDYSEINTRSLEGAFVSVKNAGFRFQLVEFWRKLGGGAVSPVMY